MSLHAMEGGPKTSAPSGGVSSISAEDILAGVAGVLEHFVAAAAMSGVQPRPSAFDGDQSQETLPVRDFLYGLARAGLCSKECFILALVYGERVLQAHPDFTISGRNVHRLILVSTMLASKVLDDFYCRNVYYANAGGLSIQVLNELELTLVFMLDFNMQVKPEVFAEYRDSLRRETVVRELEPAFGAVVGSPPGTPVCKSGSLAYPHTYTWQPFVTPPMSHPQLVMPVTIVPVPRYSMIAHHEQQQHHHEQHHHHAHLTHHHPHHQTVHHVPTTHQPHHHHGQPSHFPTFPVYAAPCRTGMPHLSHASVPMGAAGPIRFGWPC
eukprot:m.159143 g.159143  ORF g.159143 m.159143 type:complete len:324 (-) comp11745_c0_seq1:216-1187(-)